MPFVKRDKHGLVIAVSQEAGAGCTEELSRDDPALSAFITGIASEVSTLSASDQDLIRVLEDVVDVLIAKGLILFTDLPVDAQQKIMRRQKLRSAMSNTLDLISED
jgi:hypothetical protein